MPIKEAVLAEISREIPKKFIGRDGFVMNVYGCSVFEEYISSGRVVYTAFNNDSGKSALIERRRTPLSDKADTLVKFALKVRDSSVGGLGRLEVAEGVPLSKLKIIVRELFREILPKCGYKIREEQIGLAEELLDALTGRRTLLAEAPTGLGKSLVIVLVGLIVRRSQYNRTWSGSFFPGMSCVEWERMGVLVSTSGVALQRAMHTEVIPGLSDILVDWGVIREPITSVLRKGRSHHVCEYNLNEYIPFAKNDKVELERIACDGRVIDLGGVNSLTSEVKSKISVPAKCVKNCPYKDDCRYLAFRDKVSKTGYDFVIGNHNLLLQDMRLRAEGNGQTLQPFQAPILDESHALLKVARDMYGAKFSIPAIPDVTKALRKLNFAPLSAPETDSWKVNRDSVYKLSDKLYETNKRLFSRENAGDACDLPLRNIREFSDLLCRYLSESEPFKVERDERLKHGLIWELQKISKAASELSSGDGMVRWFEARDEKRTAVGGVPKDLDERLYADLWSRGIPTMLTSGTLSVGGDFSALKQSLGLINKNIRLTEVTHRSPFNYADNCLLYLSKNVPDYRADNYIAKLTDEIERLTTISNGHAAVLFTSYHSMSVVHKRLKERNHSMKDFVLERGSSNAIDRFKASGNGVLFACGSMWTGIDCPGNILSMLIIVKLPFSEPDAISEYERSKYPTFGAYLQDVLTPEMLLTLRQGHGRGFRTETDTCVVAICDIRAAEGYPYFKPVVVALPDCCVTDDINDIDPFLRAKKSAEYFK
jgi:ATP-dependent DNA helicase DinG